MKKLLAALAIFLGIAQADAQQSNITPLNINRLPVAGPITGTEYWWMMQNGQPVRVLSGTLIPVFNSPIFTNATLNGTTTLPGGSQISGSGYLGIGMVPVNPIDITATSNNAEVASILNSNNGGSALSGWQAANGSHTTIFGMNGSGFTTSGPLVADQAFILSTGNGGIAIDSLTAGAISLDVAGVEQVRINTQGLGIGMVPSNILDITQTHNAASAMSILNSSSGASASSGVYLSNGTSVAELLQFGTGVSSGIDRGNGTILIATGAGGLTLDTVLSQPIYFAVDGSEIARFDATGGRFLIGQTSASASTDILDITSSSTGAGRIVNISNMSTNGSVGIQGNSSAAGYLLSALGSTFGGSTYGGVTGNSQVILEADQASSFVIGTGGGSAPIYFTQNRIVKATLDASGDFSLVGGLSVSGGIFGGASGTGFLAGSSAQGAVVIGSGSSFDVELANKNGTQVLVIPTGLTNLIATDGIGWGGNDPSANPTSNGSGALNVSATFGAIFQGKGSTYDIELQNDAGSFALAVPTGGTVLRMGAGGFTANGSTALSLTSLGPSGSHATVQEWFTVQDASGTPRYIPAF